MTFKSLVPPSIRRPKSEFLRPSVGHQIDDLARHNFHASTVLLVGAILQGLVILAIPRIWALLPAILVLLVRFADTLAITFKFRPNPYLEDVIFDKFTAVIPDTDGDLADEPAEEKVAVLLLATKMNHPLGFFSPHAKTVGDFARQMAAQLDANAPNNGWLGSSGWNSTDVRGATEIMMLSYWRSLEDVVKYAESPLHKEAWAWWDKTMHEDSEGLKHIGINHEIFEAPKKRWEAVSVNFQPTRIGATTYMRKGDKLIGGIVDDQWISPVVEARGRLNTSKGRLGQANTVERSERY